MFQNVVELQPIGSVMLQTATVEHDAQVYIQHPAVQYPDVTMTPRFSLVDVIFETQLPFSKYFRQISIIRVTVDHSKCMSCFP